ncbi:glioma pathogenesis-related protein 1-like [Discoglossus pictus]
MFSLLPVLLSLFSAVAGLPQDKESDFINECVDAHNAVRSKVTPTAVKMLHLSYDPTLANKAAEWSSKCLKTHNPNIKVDHPAFKKFGENLFGGYGGINDYSLTDAVSNWATEVKDYDLETNTCATGKVCGHYTQIVWAETFKVGCARTLCKGFLSIICCYGPGGNMKGVKPYSAGSPCSNCPSNDTCKHNLCMNEKRDAIIVGHFQWKISK